MQVLRLEASTFTMPSHLVSPHSILESAQKQLSHRARAYHTKALGLTQPLCRGKKINAYKPPLCSHSGLFPHLDTSVFKIKF